MAKAAGDGEPDIALTAHVAGISPAAGRVATADQGAGAGRQAARGAHAVPPGVSDLVPATSDVDPVAVQMGVQPRAPYVARSSRDTSTSIGHRCAIVGKFAEIGPIGEISGFG